MSSRRIFIAVEGASGIYHVKDYDLPRESVIFGKVARVGYGATATWIATPDDFTSGTRRIGYRTRHEAGEALADFIRTGDRGLIYG